MRSLLGLMSRRRLRCVACSFILRGDGLRMYPHINGYFDGRTGERWWVYVKCPNCGYENAAWKLLGDAA